MMNISMKSQIDIEHMVPEEIFLFIYLFFFIFFSFCILVSIATNKYEQ